MLSISQKNKPVPQPQAAYGAQSATSRGTSSAFGQPIADSKEAAHANAKVAASSDAHVALQSADTRPKPRGAADMYLEAGIESRSASPTASELAQAWRATKSRICHWRKEVARQAPPPEVTEQVWEELARKDPEPAPQQERAEAEPAHAGAPQDRLTSPAAGRRQPFEQTFSTLSLFASAEVPDMPPVLGAPGEHRQTLVPGPNRTVRADSPETQRTPLPPSCDAQRQSPQAAGRQLPAHVGSPNPGSLAIGAPPGLVAEAKTRILSKPSLLAPSSYDSRRHVAGRGRATSPTDGSQQASGPGLSFSLPSTETRSQQSPRFAEFALPPEMKSTGHAASLQANSIDQPATGLQFAFDD